MPGNLAEALLNILADWGIKNAYGVSGDAIFPLLDALSRQSRIKYYTAATEAGAAMMASYEAKLTGRPALCLATSGPGAANLVNGLADAYFDRAPVIAITGQVATAKMGTNSKQYINQQLLMQSVTAKSELVTNSKTLVPILISALQTAIKGKTAVHLSIPKDIFSMPFKDSIPPQATGQSFTMNTGFATGLDQAKIRLTTAARPIIIIGQRSKETGRLALKLAEKSGAAILVAQQAKGALPEDHPLVLSGIGEGYLPSVINEADFFLIVGSAGFELGYLPQATPIIQLTGLPGTADWGRIETGIVGNLNGILKILISRVPLKRLPHWNEHIIREKQSLQTQLDQDTENTQSPVHPARLVRALNKTLAQDAIITNDIGSFAHWFDRGFQAQNQTILISTHWRSMGSGLPAAIGVKIAHPEKQVVALIGDGGMLMSMGELMTAVKYKLPITVVVFNNHHYNLEQQKMQAQGLQSFGNDIWAPDFVAYAKACGAFGVNVTEPEKIEDALNSALDCGQPALVNVEVAEAALSNVIAPAMMLQG